MASGQESGGTTLMDLITADPTSAAPGAAPRRAAPAAAPPPTLGKPVAVDRKMKRNNPTQIQSDTISAAKALNPVKTKLMPQKHKKKTCLVGAGPSGKHAALEAVTIVLDFPPAQPGSMSGITSVDKVSASDPKSALALQRLLQAAVWFLGENANFAASEYAWESATPPRTALMMLDADKMVAAASSWNPTLAGALTRLQRCAFIGSWEVRIVAVQALTTIAIRSGEPFRLQIYEFLHALAQGGDQSRFFRN